MDNIIKIEELKKVFKSQDRSVTALQDINLEIKRGEIFGIIGLSGAGKSTLVRMMNFLTTPTEGKVFFEDKNLGLLNETELRKVRKQIGMIFQNFNLLSQKTVLKNVMFPLEISGVDKNKSIERARELLKLVDLAEKEKEYPSKLSGGQKQRVAIARALATNPKVLLCDEATSALDPKTTKQILDLLKKINKELNVTIVVITHQMNVIESICDNVVILDKSRIVEHGDVKTIFKSPKSEIGKKLIFGDADDVSHDEEFVKITQNKCIRLTFDGSVTSEPIISDMVLTVQAPVNILFANTKEIDNRPIGQIIIELPDDETKQQKMLDFLKQKNISYTEVK